MAESVEDEDEVLVALSDELGGFIDYVGGSQWGHVLLSPLENLAAIEEPVVRDKVSFPWTFLPVMCYDQPAHLFGRLSTLLIKSAKSYPPSKPKNTSSLSQSGSPRRTGSHPKCLAVDSLRHPIRRCPLPSRSNSVNSSACSSTMKPPWSVARPPPTWLNLSRRCRPALSLTR